MKKLFILFILACLFLLGHSSIQLLDNIPVSRRLEETETGPEPKPLVRHIPPGAPDPQNQPVWEELVEALGANPTPEEIEKEKTECKYIKDHLSSAEIGEYIKSRNEESTVSLAFEENALIAKIQTLLGKEKDVVDNGELTQEEFDKQVQDLLEQLKVIQVSQGSQTIAEKVQEFTAAEATEAAE